MVIAMFRFRYLFRFRDILKWNTWLVAGSGRSRSFGGTTHLAQQLQAGPIMACLGIEQLSIANILMR